MCLNSCRSAEWERLSNRLSTHSRPTPFCAGGIWAGNRWECWSGRWGSNPRPVAWEATALPLSYTRDWRFIQCVRAYFHGCEIRPCAEFPRNLFGGRSCRPTLFAFALPDLLKRLEILLRQLHEKVIAPGPTPTVALNAADEPLAVVGRSQ
jgi:hypothetical protein